MSTTMAALMKWGSCAGKKSVNALVRLKYMNVVERTVSTCTARLLTGSRLTVNSSRLSQFRGFAAEAATAAKVQYGGPMDKAIKPAEGQVTEQSIDEQLMQLDRQVQMWGRVDQEQVHELLGLVKKAGAVTTQQAVMLMRCTGSLLVKQTPQERMALSDHIRTVLESVGVEFNIQLYNALLRVKLENGEAFAPAEALDDIEMQRQLIPNRVTYQLLLSRFCDIGDVEGARKILEYMKTQNLMLNETIFNSLVKGHVKNGDISGAQEVMASMKEVGLEPTGDTYTVMMCDLAEKGDISGIEKVLSDAETDAVTVAPRHMFSVILSLAKASHSQHIEQMLKYVVDHQDGHYNQDALNCMFQLVAFGNDDAALQVYHVLHENTKQATSKALLRAIIFRGRPVDKLIAVWEQLKANNDIADSMEPLAFWSLKYQSTDYCLEILDKMKSMGFTVKPHYFAPLLKNTAGSGDMDGTSRVVKQLSSHTSEDDGSLTMIDKMAVAELLNRGQSLDAILNCLKDAGVKDELLEKLRLSGLVHQGKLNEAAELIKDGARFPPGIFKYTLVSGLNKKNFTVAELGNLMAAINNSGREQWYYRSFNSGVLLSLVKHGLAVNSDVATQIVDEWCKHNLKMFSNYSKPISWELRRRRLSQEQIEKLQHLYVDGIQRTRQTAFSNEKLKHASVEELESWAKDAKVNNDRAVNTLEYHLLLKYCDTGAVDKADELKARMEARGFIPSAEMLHHLASMSAVNKYNLDEALSYKQRLDNEHPSFYLLPSLPMNIAHLQLTNGKFTDAISMLKDHAEKHPQSLEKTGISDGYALEFLANKLVTACCEKNDVSQSIELINVLFDSGYVKPGAFRVLSNLVNGYTKRADIDSSLIALEYCVKQHGRVPGYSSILKLLISAEDADRLQKAIDLVSTVIGDQNIHLNLVKDFIECGKLKQARRLVEAPGLTADMDTLIKACEHYITTNKEKELTQFIDVTKHLSGIDRSQMMLQLIRLHARNKDAKKLMDAFSLYEEEQVLPRTNVLRYTAKVLESLGEPVTFDVPPPRIDESRDLFATDTMNTSLLSDADFERLGHGQRETGDTSDIDQKLAAMSADAVVDAARKMLLRRRHQSFQNFVRKLTAVGNTDALAAVEQVVTSRRLMQFAAFCLAHAHLNSNTLDEFLDQYREAPADLEKYLSSGLLIATARKQPTLIDKLESLTIECAEKTKNERVYSCLYNYYMMTEQMDKVQQLMQKCDWLREAVGLAYITKHAYQQQKEQVLNNVINLHRNDRGNRLTFPYSYLLQLKCELGVWVDALQCYHDALDDGLPFDKLWVRSLQALESLAITNDQPVPWPAGELEKRMANTELDSQRHVDDVASTSESSDTD